MTQQYANFITDQLAAMSPSNAPPKVEEANDGYNAHQDAMAHMKKDGADHRDKSVSDKYSDHHMAKRGYTHRVKGVYQKGTAYQGTEIKKHDSLSSSDPT